MSHEAHKDYNSVTGTVVNGGGPLVVPMGIDEVRYVEILTSGVGANFLSFYFNGKASKPILLPTGQRFEEPRLDITSLTIEHSGGGAPIVYEIYITGYGEV